LTVDDETMEVIESVLPGLKNLYSTYFYFEVNKTKDMDLIIRNSLDGLLNFTKNFELCPYILTTDKVAIFFQLINIQNIHILSGQNESGHIFTFSKFIFFLVNMAILAFDKFSNLTERNTSTSTSSGTHIHMMNHTKSHPDKKIEEEALNQHSHSPRHFFDLFDVNKLKLSEKFIFFLERLETSKGLEKVQRGKNKTMNSRILLIPPKFLILKVNPRLINLIEDKKLTKSLSSRSQLNAFKLNPILGENLEVLREIFETYSQIGMKFTNCHMSLSGFKRFLQDCNLIQHKEMIEKSYIRNSPMKFSSRSSRSNLIEPSRSQRLKTYKGKISEEDVNIIFSSLTGMRNFDNTIKIKSHFNKNKGLSPDYSRSMLTPKMDKPEDIVSNKNMIPFKLNFELFLKSFHLIAEKLYPQSDSEASIKIFFDTYLSHIVKEDREFNNLNVKKTLLEALTFMKKEETVFNILHRMT
jgi:hypothetical protein